MILKAENLTQNELQHLHTIKESDVVELFLSKDGDSIVPVRVVDGFTDDFTTGKNNYTFSLKIELPDNIDFFEIKEY